MLNGSGVRKYKFMNILILFLIIHQIQVTSKPTECSHPGQLIKGRTVPDKSIYDKYEIIHFTCTDSFILIGNASNQCIGKNKWHHQMPYCGENIAIGAKMDKIEDTRPVYSFKKDYLSITDGKITTCVADEFKTVLLPSVAVNGEGILTIYAKGSNSTIVGKVLNTDFTTPIEFDCQFYEREKKLHQFQCNLPNNLSTVNIQLTLRSLKSEPSKLCEIILYKEKDRQCGHPDVRPGCKYTYYNDELNIIYSPLDYTRYSLSGVRQRKCINGKWTDKAPQCSSKDGVSFSGCGDPGVAFGSLSNGDGKFKEGSTVKFQCDEGRILSSQGPIRCSKINNEFSWSAAVPYCDINYLLNHLSLKSDKMNMTSIEEAADGDISTCFVANSTVLKHMFEIKLQGIQAIRSVVLRIRFTENGVEVSASELFYLVRIAMKFGSDWKFFPCKLSFEKVEEEPEKITCILEEILMGSSFQLDLQYNDEYSLLREICEIQLISNRECNMRENSPFCTVKEFEKGNSMVLYYEAKNGFTLKGSRLRECNKNGSWTPELPLCERANNSEALSLDGHKKCRLETDDAAYYLSVTFGCLIVSFILITLAFIVFIINFCIRSKQKYRQFNNY